jgi:hypothetical protein
MMAITEPDRHPSARGLPLMDAISSDDGAVTSRGVRVHFPRIYAAIYNGKLRRGSRLISLAGGAVQ